MAIQRGPGQLVIDPDDPQTTFAGSRVAVKMRDFGDGNVIIIGCRFDPAKQAWEGAAVVYTFDDVFTPERIVAEGVGTWLRERVVPELNTWLATEFAPGAALGPLQVIFSALQGIRFVPAADGTLTLAA